MIPGSANALLLASAAEGGYQISRSLRFNSSDSASCSRSFTSAGNRRTWTLSLWVKRSAIAFSAEQHIWGVTGTTDVTYGEMFFGTGDTLRFAVGYNTTYGITTTRVFRDPSAWYHIVLAFDATQSTAANKIKLYINGVEETTFSSDTRSSIANQDWGYNNNVAHYIGRQANSDIRQFNGYLADIHFIDGQALDPTSFTEVDATTGQLVPKAYSGSFGTNGFWLKFSDNSAATATTLGKDYSGNSNNWTPNNLSVTAGAGNDSLVDTPTSYGTDTGAGGEVRGNYCTWNPLDRDSTLTLANGNLDSGYSGSGSWALARGTIGVSSGKWYWEITAGTASHFLGIANGAHATNIYVGGSSLGYGYWGTNGQKAANAGAGQSYGATYTTGDVIGVAFDADNWTLTFYKNGVSQGTAFTSITSSTYFPAISTSASSTATANFGQRAFAYTAPSGFKALCDTNLPAPVVAKPSTVFDTKLWNGNSSTQNITGLAFSPDLAWVKGRVGTLNHVLSDTVRGANLKLASNTTGAEAGTDNGTISSFNSDGISVAMGTGTYAGYETNLSGYSYVGWFWDAGSSTVTNTQGSITSSCRTNQSSGFSIATFTAPSSGSATIGHNLNAEPHMIIIKSRDQAYNWCVYHKALTSNAYFLNLNTTAAQSSASNIWNNTTPTSTVFSLGSGYAGAGATVAYLFSPVAGYSSFGSYTGNGSADGPFVFCGFRPRFLLIKVYSGDTGAWRIYDSSRNTYNVVDLELNPNSSGAEYTASNTVDFTSNGFKIRTSNINVNLNTAGFIYAAFAESPFQYARAR